MAEEPRIKNTEIGRRVVPFGTTQPFRFQAGEKIFEKELSKDARIFVNRCWIDIVWDILYMEENGVKSMLGEYIPAIDASGKVQTALYDACIDGKQLIELFDSSGVNVGISDPADAARTFQSKKLVETKTGEKITSAKLSGTLKGGDLAAEIIKTDAKAGESKYIFKIVVEEVKAAK